MNEYGWSCDIGKDENIIEKQDVAMMEALQSRLSAVVIQDNYKESYAVTNWILFEEL